MKTIQPQTRKPYLPAASLLASASLLSCLALPAAQAQNSVPTATGATATFPIRGFELKGDIPLSSEETTRILAPFIRTDGNLTTLQQAGTALEAALKARGFSLHRVTLPPQEVGDKVTFSVIKFVIGKVTIEGQGKVSEANIRYSLPELKEGEAPNFQTLAVQTAIANESPSKRLQVALKESEEAGKIDVNLLVNAGNPFTFSSSIANTGSDATGNDRLALVGGHSNLFDLDHQFSFAYTSSLERTENVKQLGLNYRIPLYARGGVVGLSYTSSDVVGNFGAFNSSGAGETFGANYSWYLPPDGGRRTYVTLALDEKHFKVAKINGIAVPGQQQRGSRPLTLGYTARVDAEQSTWGYNADIAVNLPGSDGNTLSAYQTEDARLQTVDWHVLHLGANVLSSLPGGWLWGARGQLQYSGSALISGEQFGVGGAASVRGAGERVLSGDSGALLSVELTTPELQRGLRLLGFVDAGWLSSSNSAASSSGKLASDQLASAGVGLRFNMGWLNLSADYGHVFTGAQTGAIGAVTPRAGDEKFHVNLTARF